MLKQLCSSIAYESTEKVNCFNENLCIINTSQFHHFKKLNTEFDFLNWRVLKIFILEFTEIVHFIAMSAVCVWMSSFVEITNVALALHMMNVAFV